MKAFCGRANPTTGSVAEGEQCDECDYHQEIARSCYADMLHDRDRNEKYKQGIAAAVTRLKARGEAVIVLDIGTGTGLLSMMAVKAGADYCYAVEVFKPMAEAACRIVERNGLSDKIKIINKHSTEVTVGLDGDMKNRANLLITELFDTELIGEGALPSYEHAHKHLVQEGCEAVPHRALVYAQLVQSELLWRRVRLRPLKVNEWELQPPVDMLQCSGVPAVCDIQLSRLPKDSFTPLGPVCTMFSLEFSHPISRAAQSHSVRFHTWTSGAAQLVLSWWDIHMDPEGTIICSVAPSWMYVDPSTSPWRDHWMQSVYFLPGEVCVREDEELVLSVSRDDYSLWYSLQTSSRQVLDLESVSDRPFCTCQAHLLWTRTRFGELNDTHRTERYVNALRSVLKADSVCLSVSDGSFLPVFAHMLGAKRVFSLESSSMSKHVMEQVLEVNSLQGHVKIIERQAEQLSLTDVEGEKVSVLVGEPYFSTTLLPWHSLFFWYCRTHLAQVLHPDVVVMPRGAALCVTIMEFEDLWRIRAPCGSCEGFDVTPMDEMIQKSLNFRESREAEPHYLWEYAGHALSHTHTVMTFNFCQLVPDQPISTQGQVPIIRPGRCHAVVLWMEFDLTDSISVSTGLTRPMTKEGACHWTPHHKQGVYFLPSLMDTDADACDVVSYCLTFEPVTGDVKMDFSQSHVS